MQTKFILNICLLFLLTNLIWSCPIWAGPRKPPHLTPEQLQHRDEYCNVLDMSERDGEGPAKDRSQVRYVPLIGEKQTDNTNPDPVDYVYYDGREIKDVSEDRLNKAVLNLNREVAEN
ncbi:uncharacterized protein LOC124366571 [Homalodisca vitripennis]|uniref:uncharacterized protein LOC124366571 n=1 Tax=Homalodisca vitripennis TaxID=197043 RepID=UPI001EEA08C1|nr:uncharacterized protein LOC124366571 [Homalodisca vitripennis]